MKAHEKFSRLSDVLYDAVDKTTTLLHTVCGLVTFLFFVMLFVQVMLRYVFSHPIYGIEEAVKCLMIWTCALGMAIVYWHNEHPKLKLMLDKFPMWMRSLMYYVTTLIVFILGYFFVKGGIFLFGVQMKTQPLGGLPFKKAWYYALPMIISGMMLLIMTVARAFRFLVTRDESIMNDTPKEGGVEID